MSGTLFIVKTGSTYPAIMDRLGDFDSWTLSVLGQMAVGVCVLDAEGGAELPDAVDCAGVIVTGSHSMVTDNLPWSLGLEAWIPSLLEADVPFLGICYGHQLLARAAGGHVGFHPGGMEIGTVPIHILSPGAHDPLFRSLPLTFSVHATHAQSVLSLPPSATHLAGNTHEPNHAFRIGAHAWGVQFHPEYNTEVMRCYIREQAGELRSAGVDVDTLLGAVADTPCAARILTNFARVVEKRCDKSAGGTGNGVLRN